VDLPTGIQLMTVNLLDFDLDGLAFCEQLGEKRFAQPNCSVGFTSAARRISTR
jgi:hypothetical protein